MGEVAEQAPSWNDADTPMADELQHFDEFFELERDRLFRMMCVITGNRQEAEDIAQDAFARVWERWATVRTMVNPTGYLHRTAMNVFRSRYRRALLAVRRGVGGTAQPDAISAVEDRQVALQALRDLSPRQRAAIVLTEVLQYTAEEAGSMLGIRAGSVRALHFQARAALKDQREVQDA